MQTSPAPWELCEVGRPLSDVASIVKGNVFHRAVILGPVRQPEYLVVAGRIRVNRGLVGDARAADPIPRLVTLARLLLAVDVRLRVGDWVICGAICSDVLTRGDYVVGEVGSLAWGRSRSRSSRCRSERVS